MQNLKFLFFSALLMAAVPVQVWADGVATVISDGQEAKIEFVNDKFLRMDAPEGQGYMLMRDGKIYSVGKERGSLIVIDMAQAIKTMGSLSPEGSIWDEDIAKINSFMPTGKTEYVAGIRGDIFELVTSDKKGKKKTSTLVLTTHETVIELTRSMFAMTEILFNAASDTPPKTLREIKTLILSGGKGLLRHGDEFALAAIESGRVEAARFELPAEPMELPSMGNIKDAYQPNQAQEKSNENMDDEGQNQAVEDYLARKADRQKKRAEGKTDRTIDKAADKATDKVVDKILGKFF